MVHTVIDPSNQCTNTHLHTKWWFCYLARNQPRTSRRNIRKLWHMCKQGKNRSCNFSEVNCSTSAPQPTQRMLKLWHMVIRGHVRGQTHPFSCLWSCLNVFFPFFLVPHRSIHAKIRKGKKNLRKLKMTMLLALWDSNNPIFTLLRQKTNKVTKNFTSYDQVSYLLLRCRRLNKQQNYCSITTNCYKILPHWYL